MAACSSCGAETADEARFCPTCGAVLAGELAAPREVRKTVTVLFADVSESTSLGEQLDPESLRRVMSRYFDEMKRVLERHGGTVEKFIGDAVMAVFGVPIVHEDDALRAARAAVEMRDALGTLNVGFERDWGVRLAARIGVNTGEVVAVMGSPQEAQSFATGDAVNTAARLEQAAAPDEILIGPSTYALVEHAAEAEPVEPLPLRGKEKKTSAWRLVSVRAGASTPPRRLDSPLVGRVRELALLQDALKGAVEERSCRLVTVLGPPGQGKSRLAAEAAHLVGERATVLTGRCLPYGEGITYWPVIEAVKQAADLADTDAPARQREKIAALLAAENGDATLVAERLAQVIGVGEAVGTSEETFWAVRKLLEAVARKRPLLLVLEDVHWAEPTLLDLLEYLTDWWREAPLLVLVLARPELLELRPSWSRASMRATVLDLEPLGAEESELLVEHRLGDLELDEAARARVTEAAEGNPLFVEQLLAMLAEGGAPADELRVPPTLQSVLAARLELLHPEERMVIERAAVMGRAFWWEAVRELLPPAARARASEHLMALVRKELLDPEREEPGREHGFRFRHILIRDAAYAGIAKETRSELHERFASWLEARPGEYEEIIGYHLEQAFRHRAELGPVDDRGRELAAAAAGRLAAAGRRAVARGDERAAANLLERAASLLPSDAPDRLRLLPDLGHALTEIGFLERAEELLSEAVERAEAAGDPRIRAAACVYRGHLRLYTHPDVERGTEELVQVAEDAVRVFEEHGDDLGLARAWGLLAQVHWTKCRYAAMEDVLEPALEHAERAGDERERAFVLGLLARGAHLGPRRAEEGIRRCRAILEQARGNRILEAVAGLPIGGLEAMRGRFDESRALFSQSRASFEEFGLELWVAALPQWSGPAELLAGEPGRAEQQLREGYDSLRAMGDRGLLSPVAAFLAQALYAQGRYEEAEELAAVSAECASRDDLFPHVAWRGARAKALARRGDKEAAEGLAREAVALAGETDSLNLQGDAWADLAEALASVGEENEASSCIERALGLYEAKGNVVSAAHARARLATAGRSA